MAAAASVQQHHAKRPSPLKADGGQPGQVQSVFVDSARPQWLEDFAAESLGHTEAKSEEGTSGLARAVLRAENVLRATEQQHTVGRDATKRFSLSSRGALGRSLTSESHFVLPPGDGLAAEWGTLSSDVAASNGRPSSGRRRTPPLSPFNGVYALSDELAAPDPTEERTNVTANKNIATTPKVIAGHPQAVSMESLGADSVDELLARNVARLRQLEAV